MNGFLEVLLGDGGIERTINGIVWGIPAMVLILGAGLLLSCLCKFPQFTRLGYIMKNTLGKALKKSDGPSKAGAVSPFKAMCTALAASIGTGNIAGVSGAIAIGGPGAVFWMWISALVGMCTKYSEVTLAVKYRERNSQGDWVGGPMYYIKNGLGQKWTWLAVIFALFGGLASFGIGNLTQVNTIASTVNEAISGFVSTSESQQGMIALAVGVVCAVIVFIVLVGGIQRIGDVCALLVPVMAIIYVIASLIVIFVNITAVPAAFSAIFVGAFNPKAVAGGVAGATIKTAITKGVGRGIFSNEAGLGSAPIAHAAADVEDPVEQGIYGVFEVFMDTIVVCTMTSMVVLLGVGVNNIEYGVDKGAALTIEGFKSVFGGTIPAVVVAICLTLFALSTMLTWGLYGTRCFEFLFGSKAVKIYQLVFVVFVVVGATMELQVAWNIADTLNGLMAIPNLIAVLVLCPVVAKLTKEHFAKVDRLKK
ncbi:MAG: sodium:alanine symporter family protein [Oscillospiraceae bacterium]|jgi:AGCS family alanine or glycine:cation symporter|nr:sodium:alanine symporter family protein [Oscillospiraceae bacterium]MCI9317032.1 sodium:alanine symporter family protein [Oscillospiraceae bacterium]